MTTRRQVLQGILVGMLPLAVGLPLLPQIRVKEFAGMSGKVVDAEIRQTITMHGTNLIFEVGDILSFNFNDKTTINKVVSITISGNQIELDLVEV